MQDLASMPRQSARLAGEHGSSKLYEGVPLNALLQSVGAPVGKALRGEGLASMVLVTSSDGYRVALALSDTDPGITNRKTLLADRVDGAPLAPTEGPLRLVVEGDLRAARSARMVTRIELLRPAAPY